jgi:hypothetical protein
MHCVHKASLRDRNPLRVSVGIHANRPTSFQQLKEVGKKSRPH